ncbi:MAG: tRNA (adenosine(37)-N6)-threonylcarbamoyltransferase complex ATPase subunit type 1 TsaE [Pseudomonadota bacterium]
MIFQAYLHDEEAMQQLAGVVAVAMPATSPLVVYLEGDLGTGKTTFARALLRSMGETGPVRSPTYGLMSEYTTPNGRVLHLDLYRIRDPAELTQLGLGDYVVGSRLWLVEWPERSGGKLPASDMRLRLSVDEPGRNVEIDPTSQAGQQWVTAITADRTS